MKKIKFSKSGIIPGILLLILSGCQDQLQKPDNLGNPEQYNVTWDSPSSDCHGSMPLGNGDIGINAWVDQKGAICFYIGKTDSWDENGRLVKIGKISVTSEPEIIFQDGAFQQELDLLTGTIHIRFNGLIEGKQTDIRMHLWVDANHPVIHLSHESSVPLKLTATIELWRTSPFELTEPVYSDLMQDPADVSKMREPVMVEADSILSGPEDQIVWYHHNKKSNGFAYVNELQGISEFYQSDPLLHRTFGALLTGSGSTRVNNRSIETSMTKRGNLSVFVLTRYPSQPQEWINEIESLKEEVEETSFSKRKQAHEKWWMDFWNRSWIRASTDSITDRRKDDAFTVSQAYALQRFITACAGRGACPVKFNGSIFTVPPFDPALSEDPDYRRWGPGYWWQNTRLPYLGACAAGDFELLGPLFKTYGEEIYPICKQRTKKNFGFEGAYFPECMYFWGAQFAADYGPKPWKEREDKLQDSRYHKWEWVSGPELVFMMLDYYDYTHDTEFLKNKIIPLANDVIRFFDHFYKTDEHNRLVMYPSQACETWWNCTNAMPELAGLHSITRRLLSLPDSLTDDQDDQFWKNFSAKLPDIPLRETPSGKALAPAERFEEKRNVENPELYAVFPFRLYGIGMPDIDLAQNALDFVWDKGDFGWRQDDIFMAYLGLTEQVRKNIVARSKNQDKNSRFPAFWGPTYDCVPDQDHGGVLMKTFQSMILQADPYSEKLYLFPAWPANWDVSFKLYAPDQTTIEGVFKKGKTEWLKVTPEHRRKDIVIMLH